MALAAPLSRREAEVLQLACQGLTDKEIATKLGIGCVTVRTYVARLLVKYGAANRTQLGSLAPPDYRSQEFSPAE